MNGIELFPVLNGVSRFEHFTLSITQTAPPLALRPETSVTASPARAGENHILQIGAKFISKPLRRGQEVTSRALD
jgi:hypothetical protein